MIFNCAGLELYYEHTLENLVNFELEFLNQCFIVPLTKCQCTMTIYQNVLNPIVLIQRIFWKKQT